MVKIDKYTYFAIALIASVCILRVVTLYYWFNLSTIEMSSSPAIYKGVEYPEVSLLTLLVGIPSILVLLLPIFRTYSRVFFVSGALVLFGTVSVVASFYLSLNVAGGGVLFTILGAHIYRITNHQFRQVINA